MPTAPLCRARSLPALSSPGGSGSVRRLTTSSTATTATCDTPHPRLLVVGRAQQGQHVQHRQRPKQFVRPMWTGRHPPKRGSRRVPQNIFHSPHGIRLRLVLASIGEQSNASKRCSRNRQSCLKSPLQPHRHSKLRLQRRSANQMLSKLHAVRPQSSRGPVSEFRNGTQITMKWRASELTTVTSDPPPQ